MRFAKRAQTKTTAERDKEVSLLMEDANEYISDYSVEVNSGLDEYGNEYSREDMEGFTKKDFMDGVRYAIKKLR